MNRIGLITGCSSGIGLEVLRPLLAKGDIVYATLRNLQAREATFAELKAEFGNRLRLVELDVTSGEERKAAVRAIRETEGRLDYLINNAGFGFFGPLEDASEDELRAQFETNFFGAVILTQLCLPLLRESKGRVITVSSIMGSVAFPFASLYCSSKFALEGAFEALANEVRPHGVQVSLVLPGGHKTSFDGNRRKALQTQSAYLAEAERFLALMTARTDDHRSPPSRVSSVLVSLLDRHRMPLRTFVGLDAKAVHSLHSLLPQFIFQPLLRAGIRLSSHSLVARIRGRK